MDISPGNLDSSLCVLLPSIFMMYSTCKLNKQGDNIQPWHTAFPIWNKTVVLCPVLTVVSWPTYRFLRRRIRWSGIPISLRIFQFVVIHTVKGFYIVNEAEVDVFLESPCFLYDPTDVGNLIPGSSAFSKTSLNIRKFTVHILLKPGLDSGAISKMTEWSLFLLPFLNPPCTSGSSWFMYCWRLAGRILNITLFACEMNTIVQ